LAHANSSLRVGSDLEEAELVLPPKEAFILLCPASAPFLGKDEYLFIFSEVPERNFSLRNEKKESGVEE
jgi:hypothetical protein